ncbi:MAG: PrgI family protein [Candidatus Komeilibacteria bacterium]|nr:PrgI family protein [Candidatus Komeilibacteria bacterium]
MRQFTVPQFIDVEDKIIGPITVRQFVIMIVAGLLLFLEYKLSDLTFFLFIGIPTALVFLVVAFVKINGMPFHYFILNFTQTIKKPALRVWQRQAGLTVKKDNADQGAPATVAPITHRPINRSHLAELTLLIDTGGVYHGEEREKDVSFKL